MPMLGYRLLMDLGYGLRRYNSEDLPSPNILGLRICDVKRYVIEADSQGLDDTREDKSAYSRSTDSDDEDCANSAVDGCCPLLLCRVPPEQTSFAKWQANLDMLRVQDEDGNWPQPWLGESRTLESLDCPGDRATPHWSLCGSCSSRGSEESDEEDATGDESFALAAAERAR